MHFIRVTTIITNCRAIFYEFHKETSPFLSLALSFFLVIVLRLQRKKKNAGAIAREK